jgi:hypothetical protein
MDQCSFCNLAGGDWDSRRHGLWISGVRQSGGPSPSAGPKRRSAMR